MDRNPARMRTQLMAVVRRAGDHLRAAFGTLQEGDVERKGAIDLVTRLDREAQAIVTEGLEHHFPGEPILAEEAPGAAPHWGAGPLWVVDPLDGTTNFVHGLPAFAISVARLQDGRVELGMVHAPCLGETYWAHRGGGAHRGETPLRVTRRDVLSDALVATGFPYDIRTHPHNNLREWAYLARRCRGLRRCGAAALDLAWVAAGRFDAYWEFRLHPWDLAAGVLLVEEAGGRVSAPDGGPVDLATGDVVASNGRVHPELLEALRNAQREE